MAQACFPLLGSRVRVLVTPCGFRGGRLIDVILFECHVLQLRSETVAVRRQMNIVLHDYDGHMIPRTNVA